MGVTFGPGMVRALEARVAEVTAERDRLRDAIEAIPRHEVHDCGHPCPCASKCSVCWFDWPCPTEQAHIAATTRKATP